MRLELPIPPSTNNLFINVGKRRIMSANYRAWKSDAGWSLVQQKPTKFTVPVCIFLTIHGGKGFPIIRDLDNCWKAVQDLLKEHSVIPDDSVVWVRETHSEYIPPTDKKNRARCFIEIEPMEEEKDVV